MNIITEYVESNNGKKLKVSNFSKSNKKTLINIQQNFLDNRKSILKPIGGCTCPGSDKKCSKPAPQC
jgi:hypothetical protein